MNPDSTSETIGPSHTLDASKLPAIESGCYYTNIFKPAEPHSHGMLVHEFTLTL